MEKNIEKKSLDQDKPYFEPTELLEIHDMTSEDAASQVRIRIDHINNLTYYKNIPSILIF